MKIGDVIQKSGFEFIEETASTDPVIPEHADRAFIRRSLCRGSR